MRTEQILVGTDGTSASRAAVRWVPVTEPAMPQEDAERVVVGSHGHGSVAGALLGSIGLRLLHHAGCPVLVVRSGRVRAEGPGLDGTPPLHPHPIHQAE